MINDYYNLLKITNKQCVIRKNENNKNYNYNGTLEFVKLESLTSVICYENFCKQNTDRVKRLYFILVKLER